METLTQHTEDEMFRFSVWMPPDYDWSRWLNWFKSQGIKAGVRFKEGYSALFREGVEVGSRDEVRLR